jgi:hypothetical protein
MITPVINLVAVLDVVITWGLGWRYLLSPRFRASVHTRWRDGPKKSIAVNLAFSVLIFVLINAAVFLFLIYTAIWLYRGIVVPRLNS